MVRTISRVPQRAWEAVPALQTYPALTRSTIVMVATVYARVGATRSACIKLLAISAGIIGAHATNAVAVGAVFTVRLVAYSAAVCMHAVPTEALLAHIARIDVHALHTVFPVTPVVANKLVSTALAKIFIAREQIAVKKKICMRVLFGASRAHHSVAHGALFCMGLES
jgi:hypothetical protein